MFHVKLFTLLPSSVSAGAIVSRETSDFLDIYLFHVKHEIFLYFFAKNIAFL